MNADEKLRHTMELLRRISQAPIFPIDDARNAANLEFYKGEAKRLLANLQMEALAEQDEYASV